MAKKKTSFKVLTESKIRAKYGSNKATIVVEEDPLWLPSENLSLNYQLGGGIPYGKISEFFGFESTGKSLLASNFAKVTQKLGGKVLWADAEASWNNSWARQQGLDPDEVELYTENGMELLSDWMMDMCLYYRAKLVNNEPILVVLDSLAAIDKMDMANATMSDSKAEMGNRAKVIYEFWRKRAPLFYKLGICVIPINQLRDKVGASMFEESTKTVGGASTQFYASQRVALVKSKQIKNSKGIKIGQNIYQQIKKNKVAPPADSVKTEVYFKENKWGYVGYSRYAGLEEILIDEEVITKKGSSIYFDGERIARSSDNFIDVMHKDKKIRSKILSNSPINTISKTRKRLEALEENLFPVKTKELDDEE